MNNILNDYINCFAEILYKYESIDKIKELLPHSNMEYFDEIIDGVLNFLSNEIQDLIKIESSCTTKADKDEISVSIYYIENLIHCITEYRNQENNKYQFEDKNSNNSNLILYSSSLIDDIKKDIPKTELNDVFEAIAILEDNQLLQAIRMNNTKFRKFTNNSTLEGLFEIKVRAIRLVFIQVVNSTYKIVAIKYKRGNKQTKYMSDIENRGNKAHKQLPNIVKILNNDERVIYLSENERIKDVINIEINKKLSPGDYHAK